MRATFLLTANGSDHRNGDTKRFEVNGILTFPFESVAVVVVAAPLSQDFLLFRDCSLKTAVFKLRFLTLHGDPFLGPVFHLPGEDHGGPHADHAFSHVELQGVKAEHFDPEKADFHRWAGAVKRQRHLQGNA